MKKGISGTTWMCGIALAFMTSGATASVDLPFTDGFESYGFGSLLPTAASYWRTNGTGTATVTNEYYSGAKGCRVADLNAILDVGGNYTNAHWSFSSKVTLFEDDGGVSPPTDVSNSVAAFYVATNGVIRAHTRSGAQNVWTNLTGVTLSSNSWAAFDVHLNYQASTYSLTVNGTALTPASLAFPSYAGAASRLTYVAVCNNALIDALRLYLPPAAGGGPGLPFFDGFETYPRGHLTNDPTAASFWSLTGADAIARVTNFIPVLQGTNVVRETDGTLTLNIDENQGIYSNVWCQLYLRPVGYEDDGGEAAPTVAAGVAAAVYVDSNGWLRAYHSNGVSNYWSSMVRVSTSVWVGIGMHVDYVARKWDLYYTTNGYGTPMTQANTSGPLGIQSGASSVTEIGELVVQNDITLDAVAIGEGSTPVTNLASAVDGNLISMELQGGRSTMMGILAHHYGPGDDTLAGALGADLRTGLTDGDAVRFFFTNGWNVYTLVGGTWSPANGTIAPESLHITGGMGMRVYRNNPTNTTVFYPYNAVSNVATLVFGTNYVGMGRGWNLLAWPLLTARSAATGLGFSNASVGDQMFIYNGGYFNVQLWWDGTRWKDGRNPSSYSVNKGQAFWYYRSTAGSNTWSVSP